MEEESLKQTMIVQKTINLDEFLIQYSQPKAFHLKSKSSKSMVNDRLVVLRVMDMASVCAINIFDPSSNKTNI